MATIRRIANSIIRRKTQVGGPLNYAIIKDRVAVICANAVDVKVYDTDLDSDDGAWRTGAEALASSWYSETLNTATRGARAEFPKVAVIVAEVHKVTIYDGDDPALPMWMVFYVTGTGLGTLADGAGQNHTLITSITALNGQITVSKGEAPENTVWGGIASYNFISEIFIRATNRSDSYVGTKYVPIVDRNTSVANVMELPRYVLVSNIANDVAMTVLSGAPIDPATGLPVLTRAVATNGGVSVITDGGDVWDIDHTDLNYVGSVEFVDKERILYSCDSLTAFGLGRFQHVVAIPTADTLDGALYTQGNSDEFYTMNDTGAYTGRIAFTNNAGSGITAMEYANEDMRVFGRNEGLYLVKNPDDVNYMMAKITPDYSTGWMHGDIQRAWLSYTSNSSVEAVKDRSVKASPLTENGTLIHTPVATGAELYTSSGFSTLNFYEEAYSADLDFGTGDFCIMAWFNTDTASNNEFIFSRGQSPVSGAELRTRINSDGTLNIIGGSLNLSTTETFDDGNWHLACWYRSSGVTYIACDGVVLTSVADTANRSNVGAVTVIGAYVDGYGSSFQGSLALIRAGTTAPSADDIATIYADELPLFQENAACTLAGSSDGVMALSHDQDIDALHVCTSDIRSVFKGLQRLYTEDDAFTVAVDVSGGVVLGN